MICILQMSNKIRKKPPVKKSSKKREEEENKLKKLERSVSAFHIPIKSKSGKKKF